MKSGNDKLLSILASRVSYDPLTGEFTWRYADANSAWWNSRYAGKPAGCISNRNGYRQIIITIDCKSRIVQAHRLAFFIATGATPRADIDHINGIRSDNRMVNLRESTSSENHRNHKLHANNSTGYVGVSWNKRSGKWRAYGHDGGKQVHLGLFDDAKKAAAASRLHREALCYSSRHLGCNGVDE